VLERAPDGDGGIDVAGFTTLSEHSRLCVAFPSKIGPGTTMHTNGREIHRVGVVEAVPLLRKVLDHAGLEFDQIDYFIPHQTSARAINLVGHYQGLASAIGWLAIAPEITQNR
jgi:3-oxoacyl-[acyl-carrier-protein] synthase III